MGGRGDGVCGGVRLEVCVCGCWEERGAKARCNGERRRKREQKHGVAGKETTRATGKHTGRRKHCERVNATEWKYCAGCLAVRM